MKKLEQAILDRITTVRWFLKPEGNKEEAIRTAIELVADFIEYYMKQNPSLESK